MCRKGKSGGGSARKFFSEFTHVHQSDTGPDRVWSDPTIRRNPIKSDPKDFIGFHNPNSDLILQDTIGFRRMPMGSVLDPLSDSWTWDHVIGGHVPRDKFMNRFKYFLFFSFLFFISFSLLIECLR